MVEYGKYLKLPFKPESRKGFLIYLALVEMITIVAGLFKIFIKSKVGSTALTGKSLISILPPSVIGEIVLYLIIVAAIIIVLSIFIGMYTVEYYRNLLKDEDKLPETEAFSVENLITFIKASIATFIFLLPFFLLVIASVFIKPLILVSLILLVIAAFISPIAYIRTIDTNSIREGINFKKIFKIGISGTYLITLLVSIIFVIILGIPNQIVIYAESFKIISTEIALILEVITLIPVIYAGIVTAAWVTKAYKEKSSNIF